MFWSSEDRVRDADHRNLNGIYTDGFYSLKARNLWGKSLIKYGLWPEINHRIIGSSEFRRNLDGNNQSICVIFLGTRKWEGDEKW